MQPISLSQPKYHSNNITVSQGEWFEFRKKHQSPQNCRSSLLTILNQYETWVTQGFLPTTFNHPTIRIYAASINYFHKPTTITYHAPYLQCKRQQVNYQLLYFYHKSMNYSAGPNIVNNTMMNQQMYLVYQFHGSLDYHI